jgi:prevent-host-death family protein
MTHPAELHLLCRIKYIDASNHDVYTTEYKQWEGGSMHATAKDLRFHVKDLLETVGRGEEVVITFRGKPCAKLVPVGVEPKKKDSELFGIWGNNDAVQDVGTYLRGLRKRRF